VNQLLGKWRLRTAPSEFGLEPGAIATFKDDGELIYTIPEADKMSVIRLTYRVDGNRLITNQASAPREETTLFQLSGNRLVLTYDGLVAEFDRQRTSMFVLANAELDEFCIRPFVAPAAISH
jgi:hypothetical protein